MSNSKGAKNRPIYDANGTPMDAADLTELGQYTADLGNRRVGTRAQRDALTGADLFEGLEYEATDERRTYVRSNGGWEARAWVLPFLELTVTAATSAAAGSWTSKTGWSLSGGTVRNRGGFSVNNAVIGVPEPGIYSMSGWLLFDDVAGGTYRGARFQIDGSAGRAQDLTRQPGGFTGSGVQKSISQNGQYVASSIELQGIHDVAAGLGLMQARLFIVQQSV